jgi:hypothetical protein
MTENDKIVLIQWTGKYYERCMNEEVSKGFGESNLTKNYHLLFHPVL